MLTQRVARSIVVMTGGLLGMLVLFPGGAEASGPFAYIPNVGDGMVSSTVSVIDTASNTVTATVPVGISPIGAAVTPDRAHVYVSNSADNTVSVIATGTNTVTATVPVGPNPMGIAVTPDGAHVYVANFGADTVSVIATATNIVTATVPVGHNPVVVAVMPDGTHVYVSNLSVVDLFGTVSVIATATNTVSATVPVGGIPTDVAVTPDGAHVYVTNQRDNTVSVIDSASNTVTAATVPVGGGPVGVAVTRDGTHVYVANFGEGTVSVIATATNIVTATVAVGLNPFAFGQFISGTPTVPAVPFASLTARVEIERSHKLTKHAGDSFELHGHGVLGQASHGIAPHAEDVTFSLGSLSLTVPAGSFVKKIEADEDRAKTERDRDDGDRYGDRRDGSDRDDDRHGDLHDRDGRDGDRHRRDRDDGVTTYQFKGVIAGVSLSAEIELGPKRSFRFQFEGRHADLNLVSNPVTVALAIGKNVGHVVVKADIDR